MKIGRLENESARYAKLRDELQIAEKQLRDQRERVAQLRRGLPLDTRVDDELFEEVRDGVRLPVKLSHLFDEPDKPLVLMQFMYGKAQAEACPMCSMWADGYAAVVEHLSERVNFAVLIAGDVERFSLVAAARGWQNLRVVSAAGSDLKVRLGFEVADGSQLPGVSVFVRSDDGAIVHFYSQSALLGQSELRGMDLLSPVWSYLDLTPEGRGEWYPSGMSAP